MKRRRGGKGSRGRGVEDSRMNEKQNKKKERKKALKKVMRMKSWKRKKRLEK